MKDPATEDDTEHDYKITIELSTENKISTEDIIKIEFKSKDNLKEDQTIFIISHAELEDQYFDGSLDVELVHMDGIYQKSKYKKNNLN